MINNVFGEFSSGKSTCLRRLAERADRGLLVVLTKQHIVANDKCTVLTFWQLVNKVVKPFVNPEATWQDKIKTFCLSDLQVILQNFDTVCIDDVDHMDTIIIRHTQHVLATRLTLVLASRKRWAGPVDNFKHMTVVWRVVPGAISLFNWLNGHPPEAADKMTNLFIRAFVGRSPSSARTVILESMVERLDQGGTFGLDMSSCMVITKNLFLTSDIDCDREVQVVCVNKVTGLEASHVFIITDCMSVADMQMAITRATQTVTLVISNCQPPHMLSCLWNRLRLLLPPTDFIDWENCRVDVEPSVHRVTVTDFSKRPRSELAAMGLDLNTCQTIICPPHMNYKAQSIATPIWLSDQLLGYVGEAVLSRVLSASIPQFRAVSCSLQNLAAVVAMERTRGKTARDYSKNLVGADWALARQLELDCSSPIVESSIYDRVSRELNVLIQTVNWGSREYIISGALIEFAATGLSSTLNALCSNISLGLEMPIVETMLGSARQVLDRIKSQFDHFSVQDQKTVTFRVCDYLVNGRCDFVVIRDGEPVYVIEAKASKHVRWTQEWENQAMLYAHGLQIGRAMVCNLITGQISELASANPGQATTTNVNVQFVSRSNHN